MADGTTDQTIFFLFIFSSSQQVRHNLIQTFVHQTIKKLPTIITLGWTLLFLLTCKQELLKKLKSQQLSLLLSCFSHNDKAPCFKSVSIKLFSL